MLQGCSDSMEHAGPFFAFGMILSDLAMDVTVAASGSVKNSWWPVWSTRDHQARVAAAAPCD